MKKRVSVFLAGLLLTSLLVVSLTGALFSSSVNAEGNAESGVSDGAREASVPFRLSGVSDVTDADGERSYSVYAPYTDTYTLSSGGSTVSIAVSQNGTVLASGSTSVKVDLTENEVYSFTIRTAQANAAFSVTARALNHLVTLPYDVAEPADISDIPLESDGSDPLTPAELNYQKRGGGTYVYSNNPEAIRAEFVGKAFIRSEELTGDVYVTFEHANYSGAPIYLGYQLKNEGDSDVYITVTNVGYQAGGTWFGQRAWYDFYNVSFDLPDDYFVNPGKYFVDYAFQYYTPRIFQPITYRLPAGEAFYVIGGTSADAYQQISVDGSADKPLGNIQCANGNVKFTVTGGSVTGTLYVYRDIAQVQAEPESIGYITGDYALQYSGRSDHAGVIDSYVTWTFSDETADGALPVTYTNSYDSGRPPRTTPYAAYNSTPHTVNSTSWVTHLNPQNDHRAVGTDMVAFPYYDQSGNPVTVDNDHADGAGTPANIGNWMIEYQDHFTLVNQGDNPREVKLALKDNGALAMLVRDSVTGEILQADLTAGLNQPSPNYTYTVVVPAHSVKQITLDYLLLACSYGFVQHSATLAHADTGPDTDLETLTVYFTQAENSSTVDSSVTLFQADAKEDRLVLSDEANLRWAYAIAVDADGTIVSVGQNLLRDTDDGAENYPIRGITVPAGGFCVVFHCGDGENTMSHADLKAYFGALLAAVGIESTEGTVTDVSSAGWQAASLTVKGGKYGFGNVTFYRGAAPSSSDEPETPEEPDHPSTPEEPEAPEGILGDVDGSGEVDAPDYLLVKRAVLGTFVLSETQEALADINGDGEVGAADYLLLKRAVLGTYVIGRP